MNDPATTLDRLNDLVLPTDVALWPPAPGWYVVIGIIFVTIFYYIRRARINWKANAYRRAALRELADAEDATAIAEVLRRTALAIAPRHVIAASTGHGWLDWLEQQSPDPVPDTVREHLNSGIYRRPAAQRELTNLRDYAARWISGHKRASNPSSN
jgi:hypothetical protein